MSYPLVMLTLRKEFIYEFFLLINHSNGVSQVINYQTGPLFIFKTPFSCNEFIRNCHGEVSMSRGITVRVSLRARKLDLILVVANRQGAAGANSFIICWNI